LDTSDLVLFGVATGEGEGNTGVVDRASSVDVGGQGSEEGVTAGRASARDLDGLTIGTIDSSVAVTGAGGVTASGEAEIGGKGSDITTSGSCGGRRGRSRSGRSGSRGSIEVLDGLLLSQESGRSGGASLSGSVQVLEGNESGLHASELFALGGSEGEGDCNTRVVGGVSSANIVVQFPDEVTTIWRAGAGNLDWLAVASDNSTITITGASGVAARGEPEIGDQIGRDITSLGSGSRGWCGRSRRGGRRGRSSGVELRNGLLLSHESGRDGRAALSRSIKVLESDEGSVHASKLVFLGGAKREWYTNARVVGGMSSTNVVIQFPDEITTVGRASTGDLDGLTIGAINGTVAIASASGVTTGRETKFGDQIGRNISLDWGSRDACKDCRSYKDAEFHGVRMVLFLIVLQFKKGVEGDDRMRAQPYSQSTQSN
jgi:hypothetical protein